MVHVSCMLDTQGDINSEYAVFPAFPPQQWSQEHFSVLCYMSIARLSTD